MIKNTRFYVLDSFRGVFALCVVVFHLNIIGSISELKFFSGSSLFVQFFFVLSGFVLTHGYANKNDYNFKSFIVSRTWRLYPLHLTMLIVFIIFETAKFIAFKYGVQFNYKPFTGAGDLSP